MTFRLSGHTRSAARIAAVSVTVLAALSGPAAAQTEIFKSMTASYCTEESREAAAQAARDNVERAVSRAEASIQPPMPVGDLGCLDDLMSIDIDVLSGTMPSLGDFGSMLDSGLGDVALGGGGGGDGVTRQICNFAQEKWNEVTEPLNMELGDLTGDLAPGYTDNFGLFNVSAGGDGPGVDVSGPGLGSVDGDDDAAAAPPMSGTGSDGADIQDEIMNIYDNLNGGN